MNISGKFQSKMLWIKIMLP